MARISWEEACQLDPSLASLTSSLPSVPDHAETLVGGLTNRCWKLVLKEHSPCVWRPASPLTHAFTISRYQEYQVLNFLEQHHFSAAPKPLLVNQDGLLVEWIEGQLSSLSDVHTLARILAQIHQLDTTKLPLVPFNFSARVDHYWLVLKQHSFDTTPFEPWYNRFRSAPDSLPMSACLCHFDLGPHNLVGSSRGTSVIDWEYASYANPMIDLAMTLSITKLCILSFVGQYCQLRKIEDVDSWIKGIKAWLPRIQMMSMLWYLVAYVMGCGEHYYQEALSIREELSRENH